MATMVLTHLRPSAVAFLERIAERQLPALRAHLAGVVVLQLGAQNQRGLGLGQNVGRMFVEVSMREISEDAGRGVSFDGFRQIITFSGILCTDQYVEMILSFMSTLAQEESHTKSEIMNSSIEMRFRRGIFLTSTNLIEDEGVS